MGLPAGPSDLSGKVALLTTDRRGWSRHLAAALAGAGADVALAGSYPPEVAESARAVEAAGRRAFAVDADVTRAADVEAMVDRVAAEMGRIDVLVNGAHVVLGKPFDTVTEAEWDAVMDVNVKSMFLCCRAVGRRMLRQGGGRIVNISSGLSARGLSNSAAYAASQGAVRQLTSSLALESYASRRRRRLAHHQPDRPRGQPGAVHPLAPPGKPRRHRRPRRIPCLRRLRLRHRQTIYVDGGATAHA